MGNKLYEVVVASYSFTACNNKSALNKEWFQQIIFIFLIVIKNVQITWYFSSPLGNHEYNQFMKK